MVFHSISVLLYTDQINVILVNIKNLFWMVLGRIIVDSLMGSNMEKAYKIADSDIHMICLLIELETAVQYKLFLTLKHIQQLGDLQRLNYCWCECAF